ncbi:10448_t:CDS:2 [Cetraspora pellucida]|uniref:10448_t:CDS:1 n=1 Tax=Cetraspora pellucida TaxID=1433469 RepID=A0A9N9CVC3_9GLOM|nr:10448_t:CDS:2 [Cetraspora pellucida]
MITSLDSLETSRIDVNEEYVPLLEAEDKVKDTNETIFIRLQTLLRKMLAYILSLFKKETVETSPNPPSILRPKPDKTKLKIFIGTWNMHGKLPPHNLDPFIETIDVKSDYNTREAPILTRKVQHPYHILVIGTQECQHNIQHSVFFPSKEEWESRLIGYLGDTYVLVKTETMAALHLAVFVWKECEDWVLDYQHDAVATGLANLFGNKGGIGISILFGNTSLCFINSHLAAHQSKVKQRNHDVKKISKELKLKGFKQEDKSQPNVTDRFDYTFWFGDMNYRIDLPRLEVDQLISKKDLKVSVYRYYVFANFNPTFKFDITHRVNHNDEYSPLSRSSSPSVLVESNSPRYDSGPKQRVPSWTDRIIFKTRLPPPKHGKGKRIEVGKYTSHMDVVGFSDHRPVTGCFFVDFDWRLEKELLERQLSSERLDQDQMDSASTNSDSNSSKSGIKTRGIGAIRKKKSFWKVLRKI